MSVLVELPRDRSALCLADWMEVNAFLDEVDYSSSLEDIASELNTSSSLSNEEMENIRADVTTELLSRVRKLKDAYPFKFDGLILEVKDPGRHDKQWAYILCLFISYIGVQNGEIKVKIWNKDKITSLFEEVSAIAAKNFLSHPESEADLLRFGAPRSSWPNNDRPFRKALKILKQRLGEGEILLRANDFRQKDAGLDIIAWRNFPDYRPGRLLLLCQCAAGGDYKAKKYELLHFNNFFSIRSAYSQALFVPHELEGGEWEEYGFDSKLGITFDRGRIGWHAKEWDGAGFKEKFAKIKKGIKTYRKAL